jgi:hypothetical protein
MAELRISTEKVCDFIEMAREIAGKVPPTTGDHTTTGDDSPLVNIEDYPPEDDWDHRDDRRREVVEFIAGLNVAEQTDLLALILLGRGDFEPDEWLAAVDEAGDRIAAKDPDFMIGDAALPEYVGDGLEALGRTCD